MKYSTWVFGLCVAASASCALAEDAVFHNRKAFESALPAVQQIGFEVFEGFSAAPAVFTGLPAVQFTSFDGPASLQLYGPSLTNNQVVAGQMKGDEDPFRKPVKFAFDKPQSAVGFDIVDLGNQEVEVATIIITHPDGSFVTHGFGDGDNDPGTPEFFGVSSPELVKSVEIWLEDPRCDGPLPCYTPGGMDQLTLVPEPGALSLVIPAAMLMRRGRRKAG